MFLFKKKGIKKELRKVNVGKCKVKLTTDCGINATYEFEGNVDIFVDTPFLTTAKTKAKDFIGSMCQTKNATFKSFSGRTIKKDGTDIYYYDQIIETAEIIDIEDYEVEILCEVGVEAIELKYGNLI